MEFSGDIILIFNLTITKIALLLDWAEDIYPFFSLGNDQISPDHCLKPIFFHVIKERQKYGRKKTHQKEDTDQNYSEIPSSFPKSAKPGPCQF